MTKWEEQKVAVDTAYRALQQEYRVPNNGANIGIARIRWFEAMGRALATMTLTASGIIAAKEQSK